MRFRRLLEADLPMMHAWLQEPGIVRWWEGDDLSWPAVQRDYGPVQADSTEHWLALDDEDHPFGWVQVYDSGDSDEEAHHWYACGVQRTAAGIDYLLARPGDRGRGRGSQMLAAFCEQVVFAPERRWTQAVASPYAANVASWRALEKAGFRHVGTWHDEDGAPCKVMVRDR